MNHSHTANRLQPAEIQRLQAKLQKGKQQYALLIAQIAQAQVRYERAERDNNRTYRRLLQLRLSVLHGLVQLYYGHIVETSAILAATLILAERPANQGSESEMDWESETDP